MHGGAFIVSTLSLSLSFYLRGFKRELLPAKGSTGLAAPPEESAGTKKRALMERNNR